MLRAQAPHYITIHLHEKPYMVTLGDNIRLPFIMHGVEPGDVLRLNRATLLGSRDYTLKAGAWDKRDGGSLIHGTREPRKWIDERLFLCRARVVGVESEPLRIKEKTKRRQRRIKTAKSKHRYTILRICELEVNDSEALEAARTDEGATGGDDMKVTANLT
jgi:large subunit ribosomal protein L21